jgi:hypothetical protein
MWGLYFIGLVAYIPANPVQAYLTLTLRRLGFSSFDSNMLTVPSAVLQIITMLALAYSSDYFNERSFHCIFGEFWIMPLLISLLTISDGGNEWGRFSLITLISGCKLLLLCQHCPLPFFAQPLIYFTRPLLPSHRVFLDFREHIRCQKASSYGCDLQRGCADRLPHWIPDLQGLRCPLLQAWKYRPNFNLCS